MRKVLLLLLVCVSGYVQAQETPQLNTSVNYSQPFARGSWLVGAQAGYSKGVLLGPALAIQPYGGYFIANNLLIGARATKSQEGFGNVRDISFSIGPMIRWQLTKTRFSPFLVASYQIGSRTISGYESTSVTQTQVVNGRTVAMTSFSAFYGDNIARVMHSRSFGAGLSMGFSSAFRVDVVLNWQDKVNAVDSPIRYDFGLLQPQVGVNYIVGRKR